MHHFNSNGQTHLQVYMVTAINTSPTAIKTDMTMPAITVLSIGTPETKANSISAPLVYYLRCGVSVEALREDSGPGPTRVYAETEKI